MAASILNFRSVIGFSSDADLRNCTRVETRMVKERRDFYFLAKTRVAIP